MFPRPGPRPGFPNVDVWQKRSPAAEQERMRIRLKSSASQQFPSQDRDTKSVSHCGSDELVHRTVPSKAEIEVNAADEKPTIRPVKLGIPSKYEDSLLERRVSRSLPRCRPLVPLPLLLPSTAEIEVCAEAERKPLPFRSQTQEPVLLQMEGPRSEGDSNVPRKAYAFLPSPIPVMIHEFSVVSMNILAGYLGRNKTHGFCADNVLNWEVRKEKLLEGFRRVMPSLLLLQEVQGTTRPSKDNFIEELSLLLADSGYERAAYARSTCADGHEVGSKKPKQPQIGNAVFCRADTWLRFDHGRVSFAEVLSHMCACNATQREYYAEGKQVAAWARLQHKDSGETLVVVSVHCVNGHRRPDTQVAQVNALLVELDGNVLREGEALVLAGDFNSLPESGVYEFLSTGALPARHPHAKAAANSNVPPLCSARGFQTGLRLASVYAALHSVEPELTTKSPEFGGTLDYIWYARDVLEPVAGTALPTPNTHEASVEGGGLPNSEVPSDHVPIGAAFRFVCCHASPKRRGKQSLGSASSEHAPSTSDVMPAVGAIVAELAASPACTASSRRASNAHRAVSAVVSLRRGDATEPP
eukprot:TRINITY_DN63187_c0_g1_i1.p1 TRINITY_DN63187_c0_g1~~TRINITY_DN63187_c0_g1_i1.p1  ORF type:complete len:585 (+),score=81.24 TRINITY_DN63187_c0_g1_i1:36-1790(+)